MTDVCGSSRCGCEEIRSLSRQKSTWRRICQRDFSLEAYSKSSAVELPTSEAIEVTQVSGQRKPGISHLRGQIGISTVLHVEACSILGRWRDMAVRWRLANRGRRAEGSKSPSVYLHFASLGSLEEGRENGRRIRREAMRKRCGSDAE